MAVTIKDIAEKAQVSLATVSRVLNNSGFVKEEKRELVLKTIKELNYVPNSVARSLSTSQSNTIGVVIPDVNNPFFGEVIKGIATVADEEDFNIILCDTDENIDKEFKALEMLKKQRVRGIIITPTSDKNEFNSEYLEALESLGIPIVLIDRDVKYSNFDGVFLDSLNGAFEATDALIKEGHKKIAIIAGPQTSKPGRDRLRGYRKAMIMNKLDIDEKYIFYGDFKLESGYKITKEILKMEDRPTAIFVCNNMMNLGCIKALFEQNINIPGDIALIGFDEIEMLNVLNFKISVVSRPTTEMGRVAMNMLIDRLKDEESTHTKRITLSPKLTLKGSEKLLD
ncbi:substrate-binding domain-containing protein [Clostridium bovifaecis]|uniref:Substrate-binding domain-containing protein n=1 Tax=Clostridium bovifaecis TaxID=2184719 RepID=A0A6I6ELP8_9CLOT|nr:substrate-binding domain-containing protein [Clostridium bovifaecis]